MRLAGWLLSLSSSACHTAASMLSKRSIVEYTHDYDYYPTIDVMVYRLLIIYHASSAKPSDSDRMTMTPLRVN